MDHYLLPIFIFNILLVLVDASLGYFIAPRLLRRVGIEEETGEGRGGVRSLLAGVVALYAFLCCLAYFQASLAWLLVLTALIVLDIAGQILLGRKAKG